MLFGWMAKVKQQIPFVQFDDDSQYEEDVHLMKLIQHGNQEAFQRLQQKYQTPLTRYAAKRLGPGYNVWAEDCVSIVFANFWLRRARVDPERVRFVLFGMTKFACIDLWRSMGRYVDREIAESDVCVISVDIDRIHLRRDIERYIHELTATEQELIHKRFYEGLTSDEIAQDLDLNPSTVRTNLSRIVAKLRKQIETITRSTDRTRRK